MAAWDHAATSISGLDLDTRNEWLGGKSEKEGEMNAVIIFQTIIFAATAFILVWHWKAFKNTLTHQALLNVHQDYRSEKMLIAIARLWDLWRENDKSVSNVVAEYMKEYYKNKNEATSKEGKELKYFIEMTLHNQRRTVSQFYAHLATIYNKGILSGEDVFEFWSEKDLEILPKVIIPIENRLRFETHDPPSDPLAHDHPLWTLYTDSTKYKVRRDQHRTTGNKLKAAVLKKLKAVTDYVDRRWR